MISIILCDTFCNIQQILSLDLPLESTSVVSHSPGLTNWKQIKVVASCPPNNNKMMCGVFEGSLEVWVKYPSVSTDSKTLMVRWLFAHWCSDGQLVAATVLPNMVFLLAAKYHMAK